MEIIKLDQGSSKWHLWRKTVITATDAAVAIGSSPYSIPFELWQRKLGFIEEQKSTPIMQRGSDLEPVARDWFNQTYAEFMFPLVVESNEFNFLGASLDGLSSLTGYLLEIKCNGVRNHTVAKEGQVPDYHYAQIQHQLICSRAEKCYYLSYTGDDNIVIEVEPDPEFEKNYIPIAREFWRRIVYRDPPPHFVLKEKKTNL